MSPLIPASGIFTTVLFAKTNSNPHLADPVVAKLWRRQDWRKLSRRFSQRVYVNPTTCRSWHHSFSHSRTSLRLTALTFVYGSFVATRQPKKAHLAVICWRPPQMDWYLWMMAMPMGGGTLLVDKGAWRHPKQEEKRAGEDWLRGGEEIKQGERRSGWLRERKEKEQRDVRWGVWGKLEQKINFSS